MHPTADLPVLMTLARPGDPACEIWRNPRGSGGARAIATARIREPAGWSDVWRVRRDTPRRQAGVPFFAICQAVAP